MRKTCSTAICLLLLGLSLFISSCATIRQTAAVQPADDAVEIIRPAWLTDELMLPAGDPLEGFNRSMHSFNCGLDRYLISPLSIAWRSIFPEYLRERLACFDKNLDYPHLLLTHALQGQWNESWTDTKRFLLNTTVGVLGLWDVAEDKWNIMPMPGGFDNTISNWGVGNGTEVTLPVMGSGTIRSHSASVLDHLANWTHWVFSGGWTFIYNGVMAVNNYSFIEPALTNTIKTRPYNYLMAYLMDYYSREAENLRYQYDQKCADWNVDPSFASLAFKPTGDWITRHTYERTAKLQGGEINYSCWPKSNAKRLVIIIPGIGVHRCETAVEALAEMFHGQGCAVIAVSSVFAPDFFKGLPDGGQPAGYLPEDASLIADALQSIVKDYNDAYNVTEAQQKTIVGYSLGALDALFMAASEKKDGTIANGLRIDRYVAVNPPFDACAAVSKMDDCFALPSKWHHDSAEAEAHVRDIIMRFVCWASPSPYNPPCATVPLTREESLFGIGLNMRLHLAECLLAHEELRPTGLLSGDSANAMQLQALSCTFANYMHGILQPWYSSRGYADATVDKLAEDCRLDAIGNKLSANKKIFVLHNRDDLLLKDGDIEWFTATFGDRATIFENGGHLGNMAAPYFQDKLIKDALDE